MSDDDDDVGAGYEAVPVLVSYAAAGGWYTVPHVWIGPARQPGEKSKKWAARYTQAARDQLRVDDGVPIVITEPEWDPTPRPQIVLDGHRYYLLKRLEDRWKVVDIEVPIVDPHDGIHLLGGDNIRYLSFEQVETAARFRTEREVQWFLAFEAQKRLRVR